jgi:hypothetical protein
VFQFLSDPNFWAGISVALAIFLITKMSRQFFRASADRSDGPTQPSKADDPTWSPSLEAGDRRRSFRRAGNPTPVLIVGLLGDERLTGTVLDRGGNGLRLQAPRPAQVGTVLLVRSSQMTDDVPWVAVTVRWCRGGTRRCEIGCEFVDALTVNDLAQFG